MRALEDRLDLCSINTATLGHKAPIGAVIESVARFGFGGICPWRRDLETEDIHAVSRQIRDAGLSVSGYCRSTYLPAATTEAFRANVEDNIRAIDQAAIIGAACFVMVVGSLPTGSRDLPAARDQVAEGTATLLRHARSVGVRLALEPLHPMYANDRSCLNTIQQALDLADLLEPGAPEAPDLGLAIDVYHVWWDPALAEGIARAGAARRILGFHVCDWLVPTRDFLTDRGMMGDGVIDIPSVRAMVEAAGYNQLVEVEIFSDRDWWARPPEEALSVCAQRLQTVC
ncbi:MAG TPA: sugar phosphate isomerase/epimerase family protein [Roseiarcus sp.]|nr:sugar phosphate isomerase/epimerase family protein [Roseiarcus sp.]